MVDFHSHVLPNIDDGASSVEQSVEMLLLLKSQGVKTVVATPHFFMHKQTVDEFIKKRSQSYERIIEYKNKNKIEIPDILLGAEVSFRPELTKLDDLYKLCIIGTKTLLLELPFTHWNNWIFESIFEIIVKKKINIVLAHLERYINSNKDFGKLEKLLDMDVFIQVNSDSICSIKKRRIINMFFKKYRVDVIGSDIHNITDRTSYMDKAMYKIMRRYGTEKWEFILENMKTLIC